MFTAESVAKAASGRIARGGPGVQFSSVSTDTRDMGPGALFVALRGENFDGHDFILQALEKGAAGCLVETEPRGETRDAAVIVAGDTLRALGDIAHLWRTKLNARFLAITGSNGKTTTKEMAARVLARRYTVHKNEANINNLVGVPLTLLAMPGEARAGVVEMGMNTPGEIARLTGITEPDFGLITNVGPAHLAGLGDIRGVKSAKGELFENMKKDATLLVNGDDPRVVQLAGGRRNPRLVFGTGKDADVRLKEFLMEGPRGTRFSVDMGGRTVEVSLGVPGRHHAANGLAACACGLAFGLEPEGIAEALENYAGFTGRMQVKESAGGFFILDDTYNANPASARGALETLAGLSPKKRFAVLGDMLELGETSAELHREVGGVAAGCADYLLAMGEAAGDYVAGARDAGLAEERVFIGESHEELAERVLSLASPGDWVLVKGSRGMRMEKVVDALLAPGTGR